MTILRTYVRGDILRNKKNYTGIRGTIFIATLILATFVFGMYSYFSSFDKMPNAFGNAHMVIEEGITLREVNDIKDNRHIDKLGLSSMREYPEALGSKEKILFYEMDVNALSILDSSIKEGQLPDAPNQLLISNDLAKEIAAEVGKELSVDGETFKISGIYYDGSASNENDYYRLYTYVSQKKLLNHGENLSATIWFSNIFKTYSQGRKIVSQFSDSQTAYRFNNDLLDHRFVFDFERNIFQEYTTNIFAILLLLLILILYYLVVSNMLQIQESKSISDYAKLKSLGATNREISKIIQLKVIFLSQLPLFIGMGCSLILVKTIFSVIRYLENDVFNSKDLFSVFKYLDLRWSFKVILCLYLTSILVIYLSTKRPIKMLKRQSIVDGLKGNLKGKKYKKYDLVYKGNIQKNLSAQLYKNSRASFRLTDATLKITFFLMMVVMTAITIQSMNKRYNVMDAFGTYQIQGKYLASEGLDEKFLAELKKNNLADWVDFRKETLSVDVSEDQIKSDYIQSGSMENLSRVVPLSELELELFGIEDQKFSELLNEKGLNSDNFTERQVVLLNMMGADFDRPVTQIRSLPFLKDEVESLSLAEDRKLLEINGTKGYEFSLTVRDKIEEPLFDYPVTKSKLTAYMPKSQYVQLFDNFMKVGSIDQYEYLSIAPAGTASGKQPSLDKIGTTQQAIEKFSSDYFKPTDFWIESKADEEKLTHRRNSIGSVITISLSVFSLIIGFTYCYFAFYNLFLKRKPDFFLYQAIGMDSTLSDNIFKIEKRKIITRFVAPLPLLMLVVVFLFSKFLKIYSSLDILSHFSLIFILIIVLYTSIICLAISYVYRKAEKDTFPEN